MEAINFMEPEISQSDLVSFSEERVNLRSERAKTLREQANNLRENLERYITEHEEVGLAKMQLAGSLAKGTALSDLNDIDVAVYVTSDSEPQDLLALLTLLRDRLRETYSNKAPETIYIDEPCVVIEFSGTGLNVEVTPIYYTGDPDWRGYLWDRRTGKKVLTSIPLQLDFIRSRKGKCQTHLAQIIRLAKWWAKQRERDTDGFQLRSFAIELIMVKLLDQGKKFDDYHVGLEHFFSYIQKTGLRERIAFTDYYPASSLPVGKLGVVEIYDPVNPKNNIVEFMTESERKIVVAACSTALDALAFAQSCQTKAEALECWQEIMGQSFNP
jgi:predicted nucleotidyltransferase